VQLPAQVLACPCAGLCAAAVFALYCQCRRPEALLPYVSFSGFSTAVLLTPGACGTVGCWWGWWAVVRQFRVHVSRIESDCRRLPGGGGCTWQGFACWVTSVGVCVSAFLTLARRSLRHCQCFVGVWCCVGTPGFCFDGDDGNTGWQCLYILIAAGWLMQGVHPGCFLSFQLQGAGVVVCMVGSLNPACGFGITRHGQSQIRTDGDYFNTSVEKGWAVVCEPGCLVLPTRPLTL
jgi:hypothetical protein